MNKQKQKDMILHGNGDTMPALGLGTWRLNGRDCTRTVLKALDLGYRHIDTAQMYGNEEDIGNALEKSGVDREKIFLTTKLWIDSLERESVYTGIQKSLEKLQTDYVDLLLIHWPVESVPIWETLGAMEQLQSEGVVKNIGVSNFTVKWMKKAQKVADAPIFCNQVEYHPFLSQKPVLDYCHDNDIQLVAYSPLARGKVLQNTTLKKIGDKYGKSPVQVTLRWFMQQDGVAAIPKASSTEHLQANLDITDFRLTDDEMDQIFNLQQGERLVEPDGMPIPDWDT